MIAGIEQCGSISRTCDKFSETDVITIVIKSGGQSHRSNWERAQVERTWTKWIRYGSLLDGRRTHSALINTILVRETIGLFSGLMPRYEQGE